MNRETAPANRPVWVTELVQAFGGPNQEAFGSAVFFESLSEDPGEVRLESRARMWYQFFCGRSWEKLGPENWLGAWKSVYTRPENPGPETSNSIVQELVNLEDREARMTASAIMEAHEDPALALRALKQAFDAPAIAELQVFRIGDGSAMAGILIAGRRACGESAFLSFMLD